MTKRLKKARQLRKLWEFQAAGLSDEQAVQVTAAFPAWVQEENYAAGLVGGTGRSCLRRPRSFGPENMEFGNSFKAAEEKKIHAITNSPPSGERRAVCDAVRKA